MVGMLFGIVIGQSGVAAQQPEMWRGLVVEPENDCVPYVGDDYENPVLTEQDIQDEMGGTTGGWYGIYEARIFASGRETHVERIVAVSEAHDSGLCGRSAEEKKAFGAGLNNYTLASPELNFEKGWYDAGELLPPKRAVLVREDGGVRQADSQAVNWMRLSGTSWRGCWPRVRRARFHRESRGTMGARSIRQCRASGTARR